MCTPNVLIEKGLLTFPTWKQLDERLEIGFTTRIGGSSVPPYHSMNMGLHVGDDQEAVLANRMALAERIQFPLDAWVSGEQVHGNRIMFVGDMHKGCGARKMDDAVKDADGLLTNQQGVLCTAFFADCVPLFFFDPQRSIVGIAHAGWKGTVAHIGSCMVEQMVQYGANIEDIHVLIGPAISQKYYEVDDAVIQHIPQALREIGVQKTGENKYLIDLQQINKEILLQYGILRHNIDRVSMCTFANNDLLYSHRRDQGRTGRMLGYIGLKE